MRSETAETPSPDMAAAKRDVRLVYQLCSAGVADDAPELVAAGERLDDAIRAMTPAQVRLIQNYSKLLETTADVGDFRP